MKSTLVPTTAGFWISIVCLLGPLACGQVEDPDSTTQLTQSSDEGVVAAPLMARMEHIAAERNRIETESADSGGCSTDDQAERRLPPMDTFILAGIDARLRIHAEEKAELKINTLEKAALVTHDRPVAPKASPALRIQQVRYLEAKTDLAEQHRNDPQAFEAARIALKRHMIAGQ